MSITLLKVSYERIVGTYTVELTDENYARFGYSKDEKGYYKYDEDGEKEYYTETDVDQYQKYEHILPNPSTYNTTYSDVDKEGSGRKSSNGLMVRERIGHYFSLDVTWDIIPNTNERINLVRILRNLPAQFTLEYQDSDSNETTTIKDFYRADISENLYMFVSDNKIWKGLSTSFIQFNVDEYEEDFEPELLTIKIKRFNNQTKKMETKNIDRKSLESYLNSNDGYGIWKIVNE